MSGIKKSISSAFIKHLSFFASPQQPNTITLMSGLKSSLSLGLNFPASVLFSLALRIMYSPTPLIPLGAPNLQELDPSQQRTMLETAPIQHDLNQDSFSRAEMLSLIPPQDNTLLNRGHIWGLWALSASNMTGRVSREDLQRIQDGSLMQAIKQRRKVGRMADEVLPFLRGGPGNVAGHSWVVGRLFGVHVYQKEEETKRS